MAFDIVVIGAGPAGLCFARSLADSGLRVVLVERQGRKVLADPPDDGREIAVTHHSRQLLCDLGLWEHIPERDIGILRDARVLDGDGSRSLLFRHQDAGRDQLGWLVSNHAIRRAAWAGVENLEHTEVMAGTGTVGVRATADGAEVRLDNGEVLHAALVVAADSRFSETRRAMGIGAHMHDFGKTMLVLRMRHELAHGGEAREWFGHGQTLALLPLHDPHVSSLVVTLAPQDMQALLALDDDALGADLGARYRHALGAMQVAGPRCAYPLVGTYAHRFTAPRFALIGDAAVGMHPVTAHGFNFGIMGQATLAAELRAALEKGRAVHDAEALRRYQRRHRMATWPLYTATQMLAELYTDSRPPARVLRKAALGAAVRMGPFRRLVVSGLASRQASLPAPLRRVWSRGGHA